MCQYWCASRCHASLFCFMAQWKFNFWWCFVLTVWSVYLSSMLMTWYGVEYLDWLFQCLCCELFMNCCRKWCERTVPRPGWWRWPRYGALHDSAVCLWYSIRRQCSRLTHEHRELPAVNGLIKCLFIINIASIFIIFCSFVISVRMTESVMKYNGWTGREQQTCVMKCM